MYVVSQGHQSNGGVRETLDLSPQSFNNFNTNSTKESLLETQTHLRDRPTETLTGGKVRENQRGRRKKSSKKTQMQPCSLELTEGWSLEREEIRLWTACPSSRAPKRCVRILQEWAV